MKTFISITVVLCAVIIGGTVYLNRRKTAPPVATMVEAAAGGMAAAPKRNPSPVVSEKTNRISRHTAAAEFSRATKPARPPTAFNQAIDTLVSPQSSFRERQAAWKQLVADGQLDDAIEALKQGVKDNPTSPEYAAMLGQAFLQKAAVVSKNGGNINELGILGMSADQSFDNALKIDPSNWDAQFFKAVAMSYWPAEVNKGGEVVQRLSNLINQQGTIPEQPEFANTYLALGNQYQKLGQTDNAVQTWQAGAAKFPNDSALQQKLTAAASPP